jgi:hypothetical protein
MLFKCIFTRDQSKYHQSRIFDSCQFYPQFVQIDMASFWLSLRIIQSCPLCTLFSKKWKTQVSFGFKQNLLLALIIVDVISRTRTSVSGDFITMRPWTLFPWYGLSEYSACKIMRVSASYSIKKAEWECRSMSVFTAKNYEVIEGRVIPDWKKVY